MCMDQHVEKGRILGKEKNIIECYQRFRVNREELSVIQ